MRTLTMEEAGIASGGDGVYDYNEAGCATALTGAAGLAGGLYGIVAGTSVTATSQLTMGVCQTVTSSIGDSIGGSAADVAESIGAFYDAMTELANAYRWGTLGT